MERSKTQRKKSALLIQRQTSSQQLAGDRGKQVGRLCPNTLNKKRKVPDKATKPVPQQANMGYCRTMVIRTFFSVLSLNTKTNIKVYIILPYLYIITCI